MKLDTSDASLLVLGGADGALTTIAAARRMNLRTICVDMRAEAPGARVADEYLPCSTSDVEAIVTALAGRSDVRGVVSPASDVNIPYQYAIARALDLPCVLTPDAVRVSTDKAFFHEVCRDLGVRTPRYVAGAAADVLKRAAGLPLPIMVKPIDLGGGRGVARCDSAAELGAAVFAAAAWSPTGRVIAEEFISGRDSGGEAVLVAGEVCMVGITRRLISPPPAYVTVGHVMTPDTDATVEAVRAAVSGICRAIGYRDGAVNFDLVITPGGEVVFIEMGTRLGGNGVGELLGLVHGVDATELFIRSALGMSLDLPARGPHRAAAARSFFATESGTLIETVGTDAARQLPGVVDVIEAVRPGDRVEPLTQCRAKAGFVLVEAANRVELDARLEAALAVIDVRYEPDHAAPVVTSTGVALPDGALDADIEASNSAKLDRELDANLGSGREQVRS